MKLNSHFKNKIAFVLGPMLGALVGVITVPIISWSVIPEELGKTSMFLLFQTLLTSVLYFGMDQAYVREYNRYSKQNKILNLTINSMFIPLSLCVVFMVIIMIFSNAISFYLFGEYNKLLIFLMIFWIPFNIFERFILLNIRMQENGIKYSLYSLLTKLSILIVTILLLLFWKKNYESVILGILISQIIINIYFIYKMFRNKILKFNYFFSRNEIDINFMKDMLKYSLPIIPTMFLLWILKSTDRLILEKYTTFEQMGIYFAAIKLVSAMNVLQSIFTTMWIPIAFRWYENNVKKERYEFVGELMSLILSLTFILLVSFKSYLVLFFSEEYKEAMFILPFLLYVPIMYTLSEVTSLGILFKKKTKYNLYSAAFSVLFSISIAFLLVPSFGSIGASISAGSAYISFFYLKTYYSRKLWYPFPLKIYFINFLITLIISFLNIIYDTKIILTISLLSIFLLLLVNKNSIKRLYMRIKNRNYFRETKLN